MQTIKSLCVYCGASLGTAPHYVELAKELGHQLARRGIRLIYGGARVGLMGTVADAVLAGGGKVTGIIPTHLQEAEVGHNGLSELKIVDSMHTRKRMMFDLSDAFAVLPGGFGTLDETFEVVTWRQLGLHDKPIVLVDHNGYWEPLLDLISHLVAEGFVHPAARQNFSIAGGVGRLFDLLEGSIETHEPSYPERI